MIARRGAYHYASLQIATAQAQLAAAQDKVETLIRTADATLRQAQLEAAEARHALTEAAEEQLAVLIAAAGRQT